MMLGLQDASVESMYHICQVPGWHSFVVGGSNFQEFEIVGREEDDRVPSAQLTSGWKVWSLADDSYVDFFVGRGGGMRPGD